MEGTLGTFRMLPSLAFPRSSVVISFVFRRLGRVLDRFSAVGFVEALDSVDRAFEGVSIALAMFFGGLDGFEEEFLR